MKSAHWRPVLRYIRRMAEPQQAGRVSDRTLLERFVNRRDEDAFADLVERHGSLVMGVCRRVLHDTHDAEDVFQATFLVLVRKARSIAKPECLAHWLYGVAYRTALRARSDAARRRFHEHTAAVNMDSEMDMDFIWRDLRPILDEEIQRLPRSYQAPLMLCYFAGKTKEEAARILDLPVGTVSSRLARAREKLRARLTRRGLGLSSGLLASALGSKTLAGSVSASLLETTTQGGLALAAGHALAGGLVSLKVASLTHSMVKSMFLFKLKMAAAGLAAALVIGSGAGVVTYRTAAAQDQKADQSVEDRLRDEIARLKKELDRAEKEIAKLKLERTYVKVAAQREGVMGFVGTLTKDDLGNETNKLRPLKVGDHVEANQLLGRIDDRLARDEMTIKEKKLTATESELVISEKTRDEAKARYDTQLVLYKRKSTSEEEVRAAKLVWGKYIYEVVGKRAAIDLAKAELNQARTVLDMHNIRSPMPGVIKSIAKHPGEGVQNLETVFVIQPDEK
jgi:RNA polymerase sigma factor (sigma-70 family)